MASLAGMGRLIELPAGKYSPFCGAELRKEEFVMNPVIVILIVVLVIVFWCIRTVNGFKKKVLGELRWFTEMIDTLRMEDTLYKKEANV